MAVFLPILPMGMVVVLGVGFRIVGIPLGVVIPLIEGLMTANQLADDVVARLGEQPVAFQDLVAGRQHGLKFGARNRVLIGHDIPAPLGRLLKFGFVTKVNPSS